MRKQFINFEQAGTLREAAEIAPWACGIVEMEGGFKAFESSDEFYRVLDEFEEEPSYIYTKNERWIKNET